MGLGLALWKYIKKFSLKIMIGGSFENAILTFRGKKKNFLHRGGVKLLNAALTRWRHVHRPNVN